MTDRFQNKSIDFQYLENLINKIPLPGVVVDQISGNLLFANPGFLVLSGYIFEEIANKKIQEMIFPDNNLNNADWSGEKVLLIKNKNRLPVKIEQEDLNYQGDLSLLLFITSGVLQKRGEISENERFAAGISKLYSFIIHKNDQNILIQFVKLIEEIYDSKQICIYQFDHAKPEAKKVVSLDGANRFPMAISTREIVTNPLGDYWVRGKLPGNQLQKTAFDCGYSCLYTLPIGEKESVIGCLAIGINVNKLSFKMELLLKLIVAYIGETFQKEIIRNVLNQKLKHNDQAASIRKFMIESVLVGIVLSNKDSKIVELNLTAEEMLGFTKSEIINQNIDDILIGPEEFMPALENALIGIGSADLGVVNVHRRDGEAFPAKIQVLPVVQKGAIEGVLIIITDESEHEGFRIQTQQLEQRAIIGDI
ncbi:MAG: PAS domain-containing protein, partial [Bacteroidales bacterium]|nr:PAS domain-containing protein [Bacteroidales bacterium]